MLRSVTLITFTCQSFSRYGRTCRTRTHSIGVRRKFIVISIDFLLCVVFSRIVKVRETRVTVLLSHIFIGLSLFMRDVLKQIPMPVLDGLFLYLALTSLDGNQFFERVTLFFTEQVRSFRFSSSSSSWSFFRLLILRIIIFVKFLNGKYIYSHCYNLFNCLFCVC